MIDTHTHTQWIDIIVVNSQRAFLHLLEAQGQCTVGHSSGHEVAREKEGGATSGTVVVAVGDGNTSQSGVVEGPLTPGETTEHIPNVLRSQKIWKSNDKLLKIFKNCNRVP
jgi:hypothetical protein